MRLTPAEDRCELPYGRQVLVHNSGSKAAAGGTGVDFPFEPAGKEGKAAEELRARFDAERGAAQGGA